MGRPLKVSLDHSLVVPFDPEHLPQVPREEFAAIARGVTSESVAMKDNPVNQPAEPPQYELVVSVTSSDVQMEENPAYESVYRHNCIPADRGA